MNTPRTSTDDRKFRLQFPLSALFWCLLFTAVVTHKVYSLDWSVAERLLLCSWIVGVSLGLITARACGKWPIGIVALAGFLCSFSTALLLFFGFPEMVRRYTMSFREEVLLPLTALLVLAMVNSVLLAIALPTVTYLARSLFHRLGAGRVAVVAGMGVILVSLLVWAFVWRPVAALDISHIADGSGTYAVAISPDGSLLALASSKGFIELRRLPSCQIIRRHEVDLENGASYVEFSEDGSRLTYASSFDARVRTIDVSTGSQQIEVVHEGAEFILAVASNEDVLTVIASSVKNRNPCLEISLWDARSGAPIHSLDFEPLGFAPVVHVDRGLLAYMPFGRGSFHTISLYQLYDGRHLADRLTISEVTTHFRPSFSNDGNWICMQSTLWNHESGETRSVPGHGMCFLPNGQLVLVKTHVGRSILPSPQQRASLGLTRTPIVRRLFFPHSSSRILLYDVAERRVVRTSWKLDRSPMAWASRDGTRMVTVEGAKLEVWNVSE